MRAIAAMVMVGAMVSACAAPVEVSETTEPMTKAQNAGDGVCDGSTSQCWTWQGQAQVYGVCTASGVCCTGCVDGRGNCHGTGSGSVECGTWGAACNNGATCRGDNGSGSCKNGVCCPPVTIDPDSGLPVGKDCGNL